MTLKRRVHIALLIVIALVALNFFRQTSQIGREISRLSESLPRSASAFECIPVITMQIVPAARIPAFGGQLLIGEGRYRLSDGRIIEISIPVSPEYMKIGPDRLPLYCGPYKVMK